MTAYLGGNFSAVGPISGSGVALDASTGSYDPALPYVTGFVQSVVPDESGGWYIGGYLTAVAGQARQGLAHIRADKTLDPIFDARLSANAYVNSLALRNGTLYVGGSFSTVNGGLIRNNLAAFDAATGLATSFSPDVGGVVSSIALDGTSLYVGGQFTMVNGGVARATGLATSFDPRPDSYVSALALSSADLLMGGYFAAVAGQPQIGLAILPLRASRSS